ncbi:hypothetical protein GN244_ATG17397 [Phytophthora infestans]|uniref:Uncharacterized protein n=1 Tax=Phytophthora infestans TaxID=4787 RepID=A0A833SHF6_PHYIN|nr:hypothetical protein GN244_ATG17397 [Phytophthora infestans]KAF4128176.1 hypothetical protein GN958_ATG22626 [Phytophthora infestans]
MAESKLTSKSFDVHDFSVPSAKCTDRSLKRISKHVDKFSLEGRRCIERTLVQINERFPAFDGDSALVLLLDPRKTKDCVRGIMAGTGAAQGHKEETMFQALAQFKEKHFRLSKIASGWNDGAATPLSDDLTAILKIQKARMTTQMNHQLEAIWCTDSCE